MDAQAVITVAAAVTALTQLLKWSNVIPDRYGVFAVLGLALLGVLLWAYSQPTWDRAATFAYFAGWVAVATSSAGVFGFTRAASEAVTRTKTPPAGAAQQATEKV